MSDEGAAKASNTAYGLLRRGVDGQGCEGAVGTARQSRAGVVWTNTFNRFDPTCSPLLAWVRRASAGRAAAQAWPPTLD